MSVGEDLKVAWKDNFSVGDPLMDRQHRDFFDEVNAVADALNGDHPHEAVLRFYSSFVSGLVGHFKDEEALLARIDYPDLENHQAEHKALMASVTAVEGMLLTSQSGHELRFLVKRLFVALVEHVVSEDLRYRPHVQAAA